MKKIKKVVTSFLEVVTNVTKSLRLQISSYLKIILDETVKMINYVKSRSFKFRLFKILCDEMGSEHRILLLHIEVRQLTSERAFVQYPTYHLVITNFIRKNDCNYLEQLIFH